MRRSAGLPIVSFGAMLALLPLAHAGAPAERRNAIVEVVARVSPAVVHIGTEHIVERRTVDPFFRFYDDPFFERFMGRPQGQTRQYKTQSLGSGVIVDRGGIIVTNEHVIRGASRITIRLTDEKEYEAEVIGSDAGTDVAVLRFVDRPAQIPVAELGRSSDLMIGETVIAIGSPFGLTHSVTTGVISAVGRSFRDETRVFNDFIQTDAAINPGNSGGPLINVEGKVVGINAAIRNGADGIGFAIPADKVRRIVDELVHYGKVRPAWVGLQVQALGAELARSLNTSSPYGCVVTTVEAGSPASKAGVQIGDILRTIEGKPCHDASEFREFLRSYPALSKMPVTLDRQGRALELAIIPSELPTGMIAKIEWEQIGLTVRSVDVRGRATLLVDKVRRGSPASELGLASGDVIHRIDGKQMAKTSDFDEAVATARDRRTLVLVVERRHVLYHATLDW